MRQSQLRASRVGAGDVIGTGWPLMSGLEEEGGWWVPYHLGQGFETPGEPREPECLCFSSSRNNIAMSHYFLASLGQEVWGYVQGSLRL